MLPLVFHVLSLLECLQKPTNAGVTGLLLAALALRHTAIPAMKQLRNMNTYVRAAMSDWHHSHHLNAYSPLETAPHYLNEVGLHGGEAIAGTASFGMSGVNANALLQQMSSLGPSPLKEKMVIPYTASSYGP